EIPRRYQDEANVLAAVAPRRIRIVHVATDLEANLGSRMLVHVNPVAGSGPPFHDGNQMVLAIHGDSRTGGGVEASFVEGSIRRRMQYAYENLSAGAIRGVREELVYLARRGVGDQRGHLGQHDHLRTPRDQLLRLIGVAAHEVQ